jgi:hypothetical protein
VAPISQKARPHAVAGDPTLCLIGLFNRRERLASFTMFLATPRCQLGDVQGIALVYWFGRNGLEEAGIVSHKAESSLHYANRSLLCKFAIPMMAC